MFGNKIKPHIIFDVAQSNTFHSNFFYKFRSNIETANSYHH